MRTSDVRANFAAVAAVSSRLAPTKKPMRAGSCASVDSRNIAVQIMRSPPRESFSHEIVTEGWRYSAGRTHPFTVTVTRRGSPEVAPEESVTTVSKLAVAAAAPSCVKTTTPASRSAWVNEAIGVTGDAARAT